MIFFPLVMILFMCRHNRSSLWCDSHTMVGAHNLFSFYSWFHFCRPNGGVMVVSAHYFFHSLSWFCFYVGNINHHHGVTIVGGHIFLSCSSFSFV
jgi:hypothetical protein